MEKCITRQKFLIDYEIAKFSKKKKQTKNSYITRKQNVNSTQRKVWGNRNRDNLGNRDI